MFGEGEGPAHQHSARVAGTKEATVSRTSASSSAGGASMNEDHSSRQDGLNKTSMGSASTSSRTATGASSPTNTKGNNPPASQQYSPPVGHDPSHLTLQEFARSNKIESLQDPNIQKTNMHPTQNPTSPSSQLPLAQAAIPPTSSGASIAATAPTGHFRETPVSVAPSSLNPPGASSSFAALNTGTPLTEHRITPVPPTQIEAKQTKKVLRKASDIERNKKQEDYEDFECNFIKYVDMKGSF
jgi:hypothetical protein